MCLHGRDGARDFCLPDPSQKGTKVTSWQLPLFSSRLPNLPSLPGPEFPPHPPQTSPIAPRCSLPLPPPHLLASAHHRGPAGSQRSGESRQTASSKSCQRVVGCSQALPLGTCSHGMATLTPLHTWTQTHVCTHTPRAQIHARRANSQGSLHSPIQTHTIMDVHTYAPTHIFNSLQRDPELTWGHTLHRLHHPPPALHVREKQGHHVNQTSPD